MWPYNTHPLLKNWNYPGNQSEGLELVVSYLAMPTKDTLTLPTKKMCLLSLTRISLWEGPYIHTTRCPEQGLAHGGFLAFVDSTSIKTIPGHRL